MSVYSFKNIHGHEEDCLQSLITANSDFSWVTKEWVLKPNVDISDLKHEAAYLAGRKHRLTKLQIALAAIKNASHDEQIEARKIINSYL